MLAGEAGAQLVASELYKHGQHVLEEEEKEDWGWGKQAFIRGYSWGVICCKKGDKWEREGERER